MLRIREAAAVLAVLLVVKSEAKVRPGTCPDPRVMKIPCDGTRTIEGKDCTSDHHCSAGRMCCDSPCGWKECFDVASDLPAPKHDYEGCPPPTKEACYIDKPKLCNCSSSCDAGSKCCPVSCNGMECKPVAKPGQCMMHIMACLAGETYPITCDNDYQCDGDLKCCSTACSGRTCQSPDLSTTYPNPEPKLGECKPVNWAAISCLPMDEAAKKIECRTDSECVGEAKCCDNPCTEKRCKLPAQCPYFDPHRMCEVDNPIECDPGTKCDSGRSCCKYECGGARCEPELCPGVNPNIYCVTTNKQECNSSDACGPNEICCSYECDGRRCVPRDIPAHSGSCPDYSHIKPFCLIVDPPNECENDDQCYAGKKCCRKICGGMGCLDYVEEVRPGVCPDYSNVDVYCPAVVPTDDCYNDGQCPIGQKCCTKICGGLGCLDIVEEVRPGVCPEYSNVDVYCPAVVPTDDCYNDGQCPIGQKCCTKICGGLGCLDIVEEVVRPGVCPDYSNVDVYCPAVVPTDDCYNDGQCPIGQKCCRKICGGLGCLDIVYKPLPTPDAPVCPVYDSGVVCKDDKRSSYACNLKDKCSNGGQCCGIECRGTRCLTALCPAPDNSIQCYVPESRDCESSSTCGEGQVCCEIHCGGTRCSSPVEPGYGSVEGGSYSHIPRHKRAVRPGSCPNIMAKCRPPTEAEKKNQCVTDKSCPGSQKCCRNPCAGYGDICMDPDA